MTPPHEHHTAPGAEDDKLLGVGILFLFYLLCIGVAAYLYWHGTGKLPWA